MNAEALAYPFLFFILFFESFFLVTFLSKPAREARRARVAPESELPHVALIIPCYNEEDNVVRTVEGALHIDYPREKLEVILVNDGSKDRTLERMRQFEDDPRIRIIDKENGGKHTALNAGIAATSAEFFGCLDADTIPQPDALKKTLPCFNRPSVASAMSAISIHDPRGILERMQSAEYTMGIFYRHVLCSINAMYVTPGPFSLYRRDIVVKLGGFRYGQQTEDMEMALRLHREGYEIENAPYARVSTRAMPTAPQLVRQRMRWTSGFLRNVLFDYRDLLSARQGALGLLILPFGLLTPLIAVGLFVLNVYIIVSNIVRTVIMHSEVPLSWQISTASHGLGDWFYLPVSAFLLFSLVTVSFGAVMLVVGKRVSHAPTRIFADMASYIILYGFFSPVWFGRATADVLLGKRRGWRAGMSLEPNVS